MNTYPRKSLGVTATILLLSTVTAESSQRSTGGPFFGGPRNPFEEALSPVQDTVAMQGWVLLACSAACLLVTWQLDRQGYRGAGTAFAAPALVAAPVGFILAFADSTSGGGVGAALVVLGLGICAVGSHGGRRATTWMGAALCSIGVLMLVLSTSDSPDPSGVGVLVILGGAALAAGPMIVRVVRSNSATPAPTPDNTNG